MADKATIADLERRLEEAEAGRGRAERALAESEERQTFLSKLADALRQLADTPDITAAATRLLAERLGASRAYYVQWPPGADYGLITRDYVAPGVTSLAGRYPIEAFRSAYDKVCEGVTWIVEDNAVADVSEFEREQHTKLGVIAWVDVPLIKNKKAQAVLCLVSDKPRQWRRAEIEIVEETAERIWAAIERGRAEAVMRESEERIRKLVELMPAAVYTCDAKGRVNYFNHRAAELWGREPKLGDPQEMFCGSFRRWTPDGRLMKHEECPMADAVREGRSARNVEVVIEQPSGARVVASVNIDPLYDSEGRISGAINVFTDITSRKRDEQRQDLLLAELQHRVRNILATIRSIVHRTAVNSDTVEDFSMHLDGRINSLARTQVMLTRAPDVEVDLEDILREELLAQAGVGDHIVIEGPAIMLSPKAAEAITLALHELATNSVKYGALKDGAGSIAIVWRVEDRNTEQWLRLAWTESGVKVLAAAPRREGFGSELITHGLPYELSGAGTFELRPGGLHATIEFPLRPGTSILATDART